MVGAAVGRHASPLRVDRGNLFLPEAHPWLVDAAVREAHGVKGLATVHHVELRIAEDEGIALVDQGELEVISERLRQNRT